MKKKTIKKCKRNIKTALLFTAGFMLGAVRASKSLKRRGAVRIWL